jgi:hypothetical protein
LRPDEALRARCRIHANHAAVSPRSHVAYDEVPGGIDVQAQGTYHEPLSLSQIPSAAKPLVIFHQPPRLRNP